MMSSDKTAPGLWQGLAVLALLALAGCAGEPVSGPHLVVLGTAQDGGFPHAACDCVRCLQARSHRSAARLVASAAIVDPATGRRILLDAGPDIREQLEMLQAGDPDRPGRVDRSPVDGVMLTHAHLGHYTGLAFFGFEAVHTRDLPVWCTPTMAGYLNANGPWSQLVEIGNIQLRELRPGDPVEVLPGIRVTAVAIPHRDEYADTVGFLIRGSRSAVFYAPDTDTWDAWDPPLTDLLQDVDAAILDGTFHSPDELPGRRVEEIGHPLMTDSMDLLQPLVDSGNLKVRFTHMNHSNPVLGPDPAVRREMERRGFRIAEDGDRIPL